MLYIVDVRCDCRSRRLTFVLKHLFKYWINGCLMDRCDFGVCTDDYSASGIGVVFLSTARSVSKSINRVTVYDVEEAIKYSVGFHKIKALRLTEHIIASKPHLLGYQIISDHMVKPLVKLREIEKRAIHAIEHLVTDKNYNADAGAHPPSCHMDSLKIIRRNNAFMKAKVLYSCNKQSDYEKLLKLLLLQKLLSGIIYGPNTITKIIWTKTEEV